MRYIEFKEQIENWGKVYGYKPVIEVDSHYVNIRLEGNGYLDVICEIHKTQRCVIDSNFTPFRNLSENAKGHLFKIVTEFSATKPEDREDEKRFIIPLPELITTDGKQQYLTAAGSLFASRWDKYLKQTWKEEHLKYVPEFYRQFAVEFDEVEEDEKVKKYKFRHKYLGGRNSNYLKYDTVGGNWILGHDIKTYDFKGEFTIDELKEKFNSDLDDWEIIKVEE